jgi:hypothetical protein
MTWHDLRRLALPTVTFAGGIAFGDGAAVHHPLWQTLAVGVVGYVICWLAIDYVFADLRAYLRRPRRDGQAGPETTLTPRPEPDPATTVGRRLDDDRPGWIQEGR